MFTDTGFWDTFRCLFPLLNLMYPSVNKEMQEGLINTYKESGFFPEWASPGHILVIHGTFGKQVDFFLGTFQLFCQPVDTPVIVCIFWK